MLHLDVDLPPDKKKAFFDLKQTIVDLRDANLRLKFLPYELREMIVDMGNKLYEQASGNQGYHLHAKYKNYSS